MRHLPDQSYKWIAHAIDHWSKFQFAYPLARKTADEVAQGLQNHIFSYFGLPSIIQSDNERSLSMPYCTRSLSNGQGQCSSLEAERRNLTQ